MKARMTKDLLQGLKAYPMPATPTNRGPKVKRRVKDSQFFQQLPDTFVKTSRVSRHPRAQALPAPKMDKDSAWRHLRHLKNL